MVNFFIRIMLWFPFVQYANRDHDRKTLIKIGAALGIVFAVATIAEEFFAYGFFNWRLLLFGLFTEPIFTILGLLAISKVQGVFASVALTVILSVIIVVLGPTVWGDTFFGIQSQNFSEDAW